MFERIEITNFQCHEKETIDLDEYVTCLIGDTDSGKSAILRGIRWLCINRPNGMQFLRRGGERDEGRTVAVRLRVDGHSVKRLRGKGRNVYVLYNQTLKSFNTDVPADIAGLLNIGPVNFQLQHSPPYWLSLSAGEVSRELNAVVNLGEIDRTLAHLATRVRTNHAAVEISRERLREAKQLRKRLVWVRDATADFTRVQNVCTAVQQKRQNTSELAVLLHKVREASARVDRLAGAKPDVLSVLRWGERTIALRERMEVLRGVLENIGKTRIRIGELKERKIGILGKIDKLTKGRCPICKGPLREDGNGH